MSNRAMKLWAALFNLAPMVMVGCGSPATPTVEPPAAQTNGSLDVHSPDDKLADTKVTQRPAEPTTVTLYLPGMNDRLKIL